MSAILRWVNLVHLSGCVPMFPSPYRPQSLCSPVPMFPSPDVSRPYIPQFLCSPVPFFPHEVCPMFPSPCVPQSLCFPVPMFPKDVPQSLCFPITLFPSPYAPRTSSPVPMFPSASVPQTCSPVPIFPLLIPQSRSPVLFHRSVFHSRCSPNMFPSPCVPQPVHQSLCSPFLLVFWGAIIRWISWGNIGTGEHRDLWTSIGAG